MENEDKKLYYSISEVAGIVDESQPTLRFWEKEFGFPKPKTSKKGTRFYTKEDIDDVKVIHHLLRNEKLTISGAKAKLKSLHKDDVKRNSEIVERLKKVKQELLAIQKEIKDND